MTSRILPRAEYGRLDAATQHTLSYVEPEDAQVLVVEDAGEIVGVWAVLRIVHLEGLWVAPAYRRRVSVARRLLGATLQVARAWAPRWAMTGAQTADVAALLTRHLGAVRVPMDTYIVPLGE